ncbi:hypothetical protein F0562_032494 [Nyssa sinensis]|uniref:Uncharacterized protein n=1 Tax=Nyssa sinensis TaxID=561372 RepID=A0A5J5AU02_9ASTE|nr:hypothetical protein F0562_032494 [Nyssa sinensis]
MDVRRRPDADDCTEEDLNFEIPLDDSRLHRWNSPDLPDLRPNMKRWGFKGQSNTQHTGPYGMGHQQGHSINHQLGPHGMGQFKKGRLPIRGMGQTFKKRDVINGLTKGSLNLSQRNEKFKGAQLEIHEPRSGHPFEHGAHKLQIHVKGFAVTSSDSQHYKIAASPQHSARRSLAHSTTARVSIMVLLFDLKQLHLALG